MRDVDKQFTSYFLVKRENPAQSIRDLKGKRFSFGSKLSTSGHLMPRYFMKKKSITPEIFFSKLLYSGMHEKTAYWVRDGKVDAGVANSYIVNKMIDDGRLKESDLRILWHTNPYADYVWALRPVFSQSIQNKIRNAFLNLSINKIKHLEILTPLSAKSYHPVSIHNFSGLLEIVKDYKVKKQ